MSADDQLLASDAERDAVIDQLRTAGAEGRLTLEELGERVEAAQGARTGGELALLTGDLPAAVAGATPPAAVGDPARRRWMFALIGGDDIKLTGPPPPPGAPTVHIRTFGLVGGTDVKDSTRKDRRLGRLPAPPRL